MKLCYHQTSGGAEYWCAECVSGSDDGNIATALLRTDGNEIEVVTRNLEKYGIKLKVQDKPKKQKEVESDRLFAGIPYSTLVKSAESEARKAKIEDFVYTGKEFSKDVLRGVFHGEGLCVASNGHFLATEMSKYDESEEGKILRKNGTEIEGRFPKWAHVVPKFNEANILTESVDDILVAACASIKIVSTLGLDIRAEITLSNGAILSASNVLKVAAFAKKNGYTTVTMQDSVCALTFRKGDSSREVALCMPLCASNSCILVSTDGKVTYNENCDEFEFYNTPLPKDQQKIEQFENLFKIVMSAFPEDAKHKVYECFTTYSDIISCKTFEKAIDASKSREETAFIESLKTRQLPKVA